MQAIAAMSPNAEIASLLFAVLFSFVIIFCKSEFCLSCGETYALSRRRYSNSINFVPDSSRFVPVLQPPSLMPSFWGSWMPHLVRHCQEPPGHVQSLIFLLQATFTYIVDSLLSTAIGNGKPIVCTETEFAIVAPPAGQTCAQYLGDFVSAAGGYVNNGDATADCQFCQYRTGDEVSLAFSSLPN
jgi:hypothetical protein